MNGQMSLFDFIEDPEESRKKLRAEEAREELRKLSRRLEGLERVKPDFLGYIDNSLAHQIGGRVIVFPELANYIGQRVMMKCPTQNADHFRIVLIEKFIKDYEEVFRQGEDEPIGMQSRVIAKDSTRPKAPRLLISELGAYGGRYGTERQYNRTFFEIKSGMI